MSIVLFLLLIILYFNINTNYSNSYSYFTETFASGSNPKLDNMLKTVQRILKQHHVNYWAISGTLLGAIRHNGRIPWDDDVDLGILESELSKITSDSFKTSLKQHNLYLAEYKYGYKICPNDGEVTKYGWKYPFIDLFSYNLTNGKYILSNDNARETWKNDYFYKHELFPLKLHKFDGDSIPIPQEPYPSMNRLYGELWTVQAKIWYDHRKEHGIEPIEFKVMDKTDHQIPYLWVYWENLPGKPKPGYIDVCLKSIKKHCENSFVICWLNEKNIDQYLNIDSKLKAKLSKLIIQHRVDYYRVALLQKYGGLYIDADTLVMKDPIEIIDKLKKYDYVGFGCTGNRCLYGYGRPSNGIMASRIDGKLINRVLVHATKKIMNNHCDNFDYFDLGKVIIWKELDDLKANGYVYFHYDNYHDGTRDKHGKWVDHSRIFSNEPVEYDESKMIFLVLYNSNMEQFRGLTSDEVLASDTNFAKYANKSLSN